MRVLVVYDIADDNVRNRVAEVLKDFGLSRIQKSAFLGELTPQERKVLAEVLAKEVEGEDRVDLIPVCDRDSKLWLSVRRKKVSEGLGQGA